MENEKALKLKKEIDRLEKRRDKLNNEIYTKIQEMEDICVHNDIEWKYEYHEGGYLDLSEYVSKLVCKICGRVLKKEIKKGGFC
jgi:acetyl-CoA carboxylase alpha subunit